MKNSNVTAKMRTVEVPVCFVFFIALTLTWEWRCHFFFGVICSVFPDPPPERQWTIPSMFASITFFFCVCYWLCVCVCVMPLVCSFICSSSFSITSLAFTLAVNAVWLQSLVGKWKVCLCWTMSWTLTSHLTSTQGCDWTCYPAEGLQVTW